MTLSDELMGFGGPPSDWLVGGSVVGGGVE